MSLMDYSLTYKINKKSVSNYSLSIYTLAKCDTNWPRNHVMSENNLSRKTGSR